MMTIDLIPADEDLFLEDVGGPFASSFSTASSGTVAGAWKSVVVRWSFSTGRAPRTLGAAGAPVSLGPVTPSPELVVELRPCSVVVEAVDGAPKPNTDPESADMAREGGEAPAVATADNLLIPLLQ